MRYSLLPLACSLLAVAAARAEIPPSPVARAALAQFNAVDRNGDGGLSWAELTPLGPRRAADALFALLDRRGDGRILVADVAKRGNAALLARFRAYAVGRPGVVTRREFPNFVDPALFAALDINHDGRLSLAELRPDFAGSPARTLPVARPEPPLRRMPPPAPLCWVPVISGSGAILQMPVPTSATCRVQ